MTLSVTILRNASQIVEQHQTNSTFLTLGLEELCLKASVTYWKIKSNNHGHFKPSLASWNMFIILKQRSNNVLCKVDRFRNVNSH